MASTARAVTVVSVGDRRPIGAAPSAATRVAAAQPKPGAAARVAVRPPAPISDAIESPPEPSTGEPDRTIARDSPYWPTDQLELPPLPRSAPDASGLVGVIASGSPIRLRLYVDASGIVANVDVLQANEQDADVVKRMQAMFYDTRFLPGRRAGIDVASFIDIEVSVADLM